MVIPTRADIRDTIDEAKKILDKEESPTAQIEIGRLIVRKNRQYGEFVTPRYDVFVHIGEEE